MNTPSDSSIFMDTSAWIALFSAKDQNHNRAQVIFKRIQSAGWAMFTSDYVIDETITFMVKKSGYAAAVRVGDALLNSQLVKILFLTSEQFYNAWLDFKKYDDKDFSFTDIMSFRLMKELGMTKAFTFDKHFQQVGFVPA